MHDRAQQLLKRATPGLSARERFWRMQFAIGSIAFTMSSIQPLTEILENSADAAADPEQVVEYLVPYLLAGLKSHAIDPVS